MEDKNSVKVINKPDTRNKMHTIKVWTAKDGRQLLNVDNGYSFEVDSMIESYKYPHNVNNWTFNGENENETFYAGTVIDILSEIRLPKDKHDLPWYERIGLFVNTVSV